MSIKQKLQFIRLQLRDFKKKSAKKKQKKLPLPLESEKLTSQIAETGIYGQQRSRHKITFENVTLKKSVMLHIKCFGINL